MLGLAPHAAALRKVKVRSADRDVLAVRQRVERALAAVDWTPPGLPSGAILLVRRLVPAPGEGAMGRLPFGERVSLALREQAQRARRPWLQADVLDADAVVFVDEAELMACLARDWLRGLVAQRWWWRGVLEDANPLAWLRREAISRPEILVPALSLLAMRDMVVPFVARLDPVDCERIFEAVVRSHAVPRASAASVEAPSASPQTARDDPQSRAAEPVAPIRAEALRRLVMEAPELRLARSSSAQRRLLALVLALIRAPTWARTEAFAVALEALDHVGADDLARFPSFASEPPRSRSAVRDARKPTAVPVQGPAATRAVRVGTTPVVDALPGVVPPPQRAGSMQRASESPIRIEGGDATPSVRESSSRCDSAGEAPIVGVVTGVEPRVDEDGSGAASAFAEASAAPTAPTVTTPLETAPRIETQFGGLFYLLNAALAMGIYGDFTAPLAKNLELSPWDWLALVGERWFGRELRDDPAWAVLAELAGRTPEEEPDRDFHPPHKTWLAEHLATLHARLALAIGAGEGTDVPAFICRHDGAIELTATTVHVHLKLAALDLAIRIAGLDRDPGWIPAAGRSVRFHFD